MLGGGCGGGGLHGGGDDVGQVGGDGVDGQVPGFQPGQVEQVLRHEGQPFDVAADGL